MSSHVIGIDRPPVTVYEPNEFGRGTVSPADVIRDRESMEARRILDQLGLAGVILGDLDYLIKGFDHLGQGRNDFTKDPRDSDAEY